MFSGGGFGGGGFGQNQQQQQQQQQPSGGFGSNTTGTGFGGFGQTTQNQSAGFGSTGFGANTQSAGFGSTGFGASGAGGFGQNKGFGATPATTSGGGLFGSNTATTSGFGAGTGGGGGFGTGTTGGTGFGASATATGLFGSKPATTGFGGTTGGGIFGSSTTGNTGGGFGAAQTTGSGFGNAAAGSSNLQPPAQGTATSPFSPFTEKDAASSMTNHFQTISFTDPYKNWSLEELRLQDYMQNRTKAAGPSGFGSGGTGFGAFGQQQQQQQQQTTGGFGQPQTTSAAGGGLFGTASNAANTGFGTAATGGFGTAGAAAGGLFGQQKPAGTGIFGSSTAGAGAGAATGGLFGAQNNAGAGFGNTGATGGFGQAAPSTGTGLFGAQNQPKPAGFGTGFGSTTTTGGFGQPATGNTLFGQQQQPAASAATGTGGLFGTTQQTTGGFGQQATGAFGGGGGFGAQNTQQQQQPATGFGAFGQAAAQTPAKPAFGGFGAASTTPAPAVGGGLFGQAQQAQQPAAGGGLFGNNKPFGATATPATGGLFGQQQAQQPAQTGGLFGQQPAAAGTGGLFGQPQQAAQAGGLFGNQPKPGGLFGQPAQPAANGGGLFAGAATQPQGSSLFGQPAQNTGVGFGQSSAGGLFAGANQPAQQGFGASLFQSQQMQQQQQQMPQALTASIMDQRPYGNISLLDASLAASTAPSLLATPVSGAKKKAAMIPHSKIAPRQPALTPRVASPFSRSSLGTSSPMAGGSLGRTFTGSSSRIGLGGSVFDSAGTSDDSILNTSAFTPGGNRSNSLKRLVIDRNLRDSDLFVKEGETKAIKAAQENTITPENIIKKTVSFDASPRSQTESPSSGADLGYMRTPTRHSSAPISSPAPENALVRVPSPEPETETPEPVQPEQEAESSAVRGTGEKVGDYWSIPTVEKLKSMPREKLAAVPDLLVGRKNFGQIRFDQPVDLTAFADALGAILGGVITFADRVCTVYPPGWDKPLPGNGLNVPATIMLEECYPTDREHKQPIRDPEHPRYQFHLRRLKNIKDTEFVDYLVQDGIWIFKVQHFTTYGLQEEDDETDGYVDDSVYTDATPTKRFGSSILEESSFASPADITFEDDSIADDTFDFKRSKKASSMRFIDETLTSDIVDPADASGESVEGSDLSEEEGESTQILPHEDVSIVDEDDDDTQLAPIAEDYREATPEVKLGVGRDWTDQLSRTISPVKNRAPLGFRTSIASTRNPFGDVSNVDFSESLFASRNRDFESPYRPSVRVFSSPVVSRNKKSSSVSQYQRPEAFDREAQQPDDREWRQCVRPTWGPISEVIFAGSIEGGRSRAFGEIKSSKTHRAKLQYSAGASTTAINLLEFQLAASEITQDRSNIPFAKLDVNLGFDQFTKARFGTSSQQQHEKAVWQLASILFDPLEDSYPPGVNELHVRLHLRAKKRKLELSNFFEELVAADVAADEKAASAPEASALALLSGHDVDAAVDHLILGNDFRLATLIPLIGGDRQAREDVKKQIESWRSSGVLAEIPIAIRALYELVAGNVGFSEGVSAPMEDSTPSFWIGEMIGLDWRRTFALRLWYESFEDQALEEAVLRYQKAFNATETQHVRHPEPWYYPENRRTHKAGNEEEPVYDTLWGLLNMYADENYPLERVLLPRSYSPNPCDFRLAWQLRMMLAEKNIRDFTEDTMMLVDEEETMASSVAAEKLTLDFANQLEAEGQWHWAVFVLMHLSTPESRAFTIKEILAKHVSDLTAKNEKQDFILHRLLIPSAWVYEAKALQARFQQDHFEEVECLLSASAWSEAHKTLLNHAAPLCIVNEDLEKLYGLISKFTDSGLVENWTTGAQVYLDFITLSTIMHNYRTFSPAIPKVKGIPKQNSKRDVAKRLMEGLPKVDIREFLPGVAVREMSRVLADYVLKSHDLGIEGGRVLGLPLTEDQLLYKELTLKTREGMVMG